MRKTALNFTYGGESSMAYNVMQVNFSSSVLQDEVVLPSRTLNYEIRKNTSIADFYSVENSEPLTFEMEILFSNEYKEDTILNREYLAKIIRWLRRDTYLPLVFDTMPDVIFYAIINSDFVISHNTRNEGCLRVGVTCNSPYGFTAVQNSPVYENTDVSTIQINTNSDLDTSLSKILIKKIGDGNLLIKNKSNGSEINLENLLDGDQIIIDNFNHLISASNSLNESIIINDKKINHSWLELWAEVNEIELNGNAEIQFLWQGYKII